MALGLALQAVIRASGVGGAGALQPSPSSNGEAPSPSELVQLPAGSGSSWPAGWWPSVPGCLFAGGCSLSIPCHVGLFRGQLTTRRLASSEQVNKKQRQKYREGEQDRSRTFND